MLAASQVPASDIQRSQRESPLLSVGSRAAQCRLGQTVPGSTQGPTNAQAAGQLQHSSNLQCQRWVAQGMQRLQRQQRCSSSTFAPIIDPAHAGEPPQLVAVPTHFFKVLLGEGSTSSGGGSFLGAFVMPNQAIEPGTPLTAFSVPLSPLEEMSGGCGVPLWWCCTSCPHTSASTCSHRQPCSLLAPAAASVAESASEDRHAHHSPRLQRIERLEGCCCTGLHTLAQTMIAEHRQAACTWLSLAVTLITAAADQLDIHSLCRADILSAVRGRGAQASAGLSVPGVAAPGGASRWRS